METIKYINIDFSKKVYDKIIAKASDVKSRFIQFRMLDNQKTIDLTGIIPRVYFLKQDGTEGFNDLVVNDPKSGLAILELTEQMLAIAGMVKMELNLFKDNSRLSNIEFEVNVLKSLTNAFSITSTNEWGSLIEGLSKLNEYDSYRNEIINSKINANNHVFKTLKERLDNSDSEIFSINSNIDQAKGEFNSLSERLFNSDKELNNTINTINRLHKRKIDIATLSNYDSNDISKVINSISFEENVLYYLNEGDVACRNVCKVNLPKGAKLQIQGDITCYSSFMECKLSLEGSTIDIECIKANTENIYEKGFHLIKGAESTINIGKIIGFQKGLLLKPLTAPNDWIQYCKINFFNITSDVAIELSVFGQSTWINENTFNGGGLGGRVNVWFKKEFVEINPLSLINNNKFYNLGIQSSEEAIKIDKSSGETNYFYNLRFHEQHWNQEKPYIYDQGSYNYFDSLYMVPYENIKLGKDSRFVGYIHSKEWNTYTERFDFISNEAIGDIPGKNLILKKNQKGNSINFIDGEYKMYSPTEVVACGMYDQQIGNIRMQNCMFYNNNNFHLRKGGYSNSTVVLWSSSGKKITLTDNGVYLVMLGANKDYFEVHQLSNGDGVISN